jgi:hypothetical protein
MKNKIYIFYSILFICMGVFALNFNFIEGDDARTVLYHVFGRNKAFQPPYSSYHSMFDTFLSLFRTSDELTLKYISIGSSFVFGLISLILLAYLINLKIDKKIKINYYIFLLIPFIIPEILFSSLIVNPTLISFGFLLLSHILFIKYIDKKDIKMLFLTIIFFGIGVSFRWNNGFYLFVLFGDFILPETIYKNKIISLERLKKSFIIFPLFVISIFLFIQISGYTFFDIIDTFKSGSSYINKMELSYLALGTSAVAFLTPSFMILLILGIFYCFKNNMRRSIIWLFIALIPYIGLGLFPSFKYMVNVVPVLLVIIIQGYAFIKNKYIKATIVGLILIPWFMGVQIDINSTWGPKFELKIKSDTSNKKQDYNPDKYIELKNIKLVLGSGTALPTPEGPRPLFGFGSALFFKWRSFINEVNDEQNKTVRFVEQNKRGIILQDVNHSFIISKLIELGYSTNDSFNKKIDGKIERRFYKGTNSITIIVLNDKNSLFNRPLIDELIKNKNEVAVYASYTNIISKLKQVYKGEFIQKGAYWGVFKE